MLRLVSLIVFIALVTFVIFTLNKSDLEDPKIASSEVKEEAVITTDHTEELPLEPALEINISVLDDYVKKCVGDREDESIESFTETQDEDTLHDIPQSQFIDVFSLPLGDGKNKIRALIKYAQSFPEDEVIRTDIVRVCTQKPTLTECSQELFNDIALDSSSDGEIWSYMANFYAGNNDAENTLKALNRALESNYYGNSFGEDISRHVFELSRDNSANFHASLMDAISMAAINNPAYPAVFKFCGVNTDDVYVSSLCFRLGQDWLSRGKTELLSRLGMSLMKVMIDKGVFNSNQIRVPEEYETYLKINNDYNFHQATRVMEFNEDLMLNWISSLRELGELKAKVILVNDVVKLAEARDFKYCNEKPN